MPEETTQLTIKSTTASWIAGVTGVAMVALGSFIGNYGGVVQTKRNLLKDSDPVTQKVLITTIEENGDTFSVNKIDTIGYYVPKEKLQP